MKSIEHQPREVFVDLSTPSQIPEVALNSVRFEAEETGLESSLREPLL